MGHDLSSACPHDQTPYCRNDGEVLRRLTWCDRGGRSTMANEV
ncbi:hypothetical protein SCH4B_0104 [Ruegeria sp. TrichCH4B]|nr:hypothetical protein SCH4B_0104 [Ruegeria sp. TrichCH4B]